MKNIITQDEKNAIDGLCRELGIRNYTINSDRTINVDGNVNIILGYKYKNIPLKFNIVGGSFICKNQTLSTLKGCPKYVGGSFNCSGNRITSLKFCPKKIHGDFICTHNSIVNLIDGPIHVGGNYNVAVNNLESLVGCAEKILGNLQVGQNPRLISTFAGNTDIELMGNLITSERSQIPNIISSCDAPTIRMVLKYQRHFEIWNTDGTLNMKNFNDLLEEIKDGLL